MKTVLSLVLFCFFFTSAYSQNISESEIPVHVRQNLKKKYPAVKDTKWRKAGESYIASQLVNKKKTTVVYDTSGKILSTETEVKTIELPKMMTDFIVANFKAKTPSNVVRISDSAGKSSYAAEIDHMRYIFDDKGNFVKQLQEYEF